MDYQISHFCVKSFQFHDYYIEGTKSFSYVAEQLKTFKWKNNETKSSLKLTVLKQILLHIKNNIK